MHAVNPGRWLPVLVGVACALVAAGMGPSPAVASNGFLSGGVHTDGAVRAIAGPDRFGGTYIGGDFDEVFNASGSGIVLGGFTQEAWELGNGPLVTGGAVHAAVPDGSGGWILGGTFTRVNGVARERLAWVDAAFQLKPWNPGANGKVRALAYSAQLNKVFVGGEFTRVGGASRQHLAALNGSTGAVLSAPSGANGTVNVLVLDDFLYVGGEFRGTASIGGANRNHVARLRADTGVVDAQWNPDANKPVRAIAISRHHVYLGGTFTTISRKLTSGLARIRRDSTNGTRDDWHVLGEVGPSTTFAVNALDVGGPPDIAIPGWDQSEYLYVGGNFFWLEPGVLVTNLVRFRITDGQTPALDAGFRPEPNGTVWSVNHFGSVVYVGGEFHGTQSIGGIDADYVARVTYGLQTPTGGVGDASWRPQVNGPVYAIADFTNHRLVNPFSFFIGGSFSRTSGVKRSNLARINPDGSVDRAWQADTNGPVHALAVRDSSIYAGGAFTRIGPDPSAMVTRNLVARLHGAGGGDVVDDHWKPSVEGTAVDALHIDDQGHVFAGGAFTKVGDMNVSNLAELTASGANSLFKPNPNGRVRVLTGRDDRVYAGGDFTQFGGVQRDRLARFDASSGAVDPSWTPSATETVHALAADDDGSLFVGGDFQSAFGDPAGNHKRTRLAKLDQDGAVVPEWHADASGSVKALALYGDHLYAGGDFTGTNSLRGMRRDRLARVSASTGAVDPGFTPSLAGGSVLALHARGNRLLAGGQFAEAGVIGEAGATPAPGLSTYTLAAGAALDIDRPDFGPVWIDGNAKSLTITLRNTGEVELRPGAARIAGTQAAEFSITSDACSGNPLPPGKSCAVTVAYDPIDEGVDEATVQFPYDGQHTVTARATGHGTPETLVLEPGTHEFGPVNLGESVAHRLTLTNTGNTVREIRDPAEIRTAPGHDIGSASQFTVDDDRCHGRELQPQESCTVQVAFNPSIAGTYGVALRLVDARSGDAVRTTVTGRGTVPKAIITPIAQSFTHNLGEDRFPEKEFVIESYGDGVVRLSPGAINGAGKSAFALPNPSQCARDLEPGDRCTLTVRFAPRESGSHHATLRVPGNVDGGVLTAELNGTGRAPDPALEFEAASWQPTIAIGEVGSSRFSLTNKGDGPLFIKRVRITGSDAFVLEESAKRALPLPGNRCVDDRTLYPGETCWNVIYFQAKCAPGGEHTAALEIEHALGTVRYQLTARVTGGPCQFSSGEVPQAPAAPAFDRPPGLQESAPSPQEAPGDGRPPGKVTGPLVTGRGSEARENRVVKLNGATVSLLTAGSGSSAAGTLTVTPAVVRTGKLPIASVACCSTSARSMVITATATRGTTLVGRARTTVKRGRRARVVLKLTRQGRRLIRTGKGSLTLKLTASSTGRPRKAVPTIIRTVKLAKPARRA